MLGVNDGVPVMKCGFNLLKERGIIPLDTPRVNCLEHNLNLVLKKIKDLQEFEKTDRFINDFQKLLSHSKINKKIFKKIHRKSFISFNEVRFSSIIITVEYIYINLFRKFMFI